MGLWDTLMGHHESVYQQPQPENHKSSWTHELIAGAAAFEAMKAYENKQRSEGLPVNHGFAKEMLAAVAAAEVDKLVETKGLDYIDRERAKQHAVQQAHQAYDEKYGGMQQGQQFGGGGQQGGYNQGGQGGYGQGGPGYGQQGGGYGGGPLGGYGGGEGHHGGEHHGGHHHEHEREREERERWERERGQQGGGGGYGGPQQGGYGGQQQGGYGGGQGNY